MTTTPIIALPLLKEPLILYTAASLKSMGSNLAQVQEGREHAICYASEAVLKTQTRYSALKSEFLAVVNFEQHFRHYQLCRKFTINTDHRAFQWLHNLKDPDALTARLLEKLAAFNYEVAHRPRNSIGHGDDLSPTPLQAFNSIVTEDKSEEMHKADEEWPNRTTERRSDSKRFN